MIVRLKEGETVRYADLTPRQPYLVIGIEADELRILNDHGRPYLYSKDAFEVVDAREPDDWVTDYGDEHERYSYSPALNAPGFFEDFFDSKPEAVTTFWRALNRHLAAA